jgi:hypothetical protein
MIIDTGNLLLLAKLMLAATLICPQLNATEVNYTQTPINIDGIAEPTWDRANWQSMSHLMAGTLPTTEDFSGKYRLLWDKDFLYLQAEITDDVLIDKFADPTKRYWDDDALEIFIDSDASGGLHQFNHTALAYHIALDNQAIDLGDDQKAHTYNNHLVSRWKRSVSQPHKIIWEVAIRLYPDTYTDAKPLPSLILTADKKVGFMLAYCDNDGSETREHFMGSHKITPVNGDTNRGWIDASVFGNITLKK